jgi:hypothetical protein
MLIPWHCYFGWHTGLHALCHTQRRRFAGVHSSVLPLLLVLLLLLLLLLVLLAEGATCKRLPPRSASNWRKPSRLICYR